MKTKSTSPRAISTFKTLETRETYRMVEEITDILKSKVNHTLSSHKIVKAGHKLGYCRPLYDGARIAQAHPYIKILSEMTDPKSVHFNSHIEEIHNKSGIYSYRMRYDFYRKPGSGAWVRVKGTPMVAKMPINQ